MLREEESRAQTRFLVPKSAAYRSVQLFVRPLSGQTQTTVQSVRLLLLGAPRVYMLQMDVTLPELSYQYWDEEWREHEGTARLNSDLLLSWMAIGGVDPSEAQVGAEASEIIDLLRSLAAQQELAVVVARLRHFESHTLAREGPGLRRVVIVGSAFVFWVVVWLLGVRSLRERQ